MDILTMPTCSEIEAFLLPPSGSSVRGITCEKDGDIKINKKTTDKKYFIAPDLKRGLILQI